MSGEWNEKNIPLEWHTLNLISLEMKIEKRQDVKCRLSWDFLSLSQFQDVGEKSFSEKFPALNVNVGNKYHAFHTWHVTQITTMKTRFESLTEIKFENRTHSRCNWIFKEMTIELVTFILYEEYGIYCFLRSECKLRLHKETRIAILLQCIGWK